MAFFVSGSIWLLATPTNQSLGICYTKHEIKEAVFARGVNFMSQFCLCANECTEEGGRPFPRAQAKVDLWPEVPLGFSLLVTTYLDPRFKEVIKTI